MLKYTKTGDEKLLPTLDGIKWRKAYPVEDKGSFSLTLVDDKTITVSQAATGFSITVKRLRGGYFKFDLTVTQNPEVVQGLCTGTPVVKEEVEPDPTASVTHVSFVKRKTCP